MEARLLHEGRCFLDPSFILSFFFFFLSLEISDFLTLLFLDSELTSLRSVLGPILLQGSAPRESRVEECLMAFPWCYVLGWPLGLIRGAGA